MHPTNESRPLRMPHIGNTPAECAVDLVWVGFFRCYVELQSKLSWSLQKKLLIV